MGIYEKLGLKKIINASDTYTKIGGSRMCSITLNAMCEAATSFVSISELANKVCANIAQMTQNESAFISSGAAACVVLSVASLITEGDPQLLKQLPDANNCLKDEIIVFSNQTTIPMLPYWKLIQLAGAKLITIDATLDAISNAVSEKTAGMFFFLADYYEKDVPDIVDVIKTCQSNNIPIIIDAAAQLPPKSNMWHYTKELGADGIIFSGGKFISGPQATGIFLGREYITHPMYELVFSSANIGRPYKVSKEEYAAIYTAVKLFLEADPKDEYRRLNGLLDEVVEGLGDVHRLDIRRVQHGRLGQDAPMIIIDLPDGKLGSDCAIFMYEKCDPAIDIGWYNADDKSGRKDQIFINSINLRTGEGDYIARQIKRFLEV
ncbi:MAG: aminotransferase class V-fold PLP-dependent enzyme [Clostridiales bacterium]|nr:aminotransferase class V-fold PLP-dependent enzyme [Clostridiales bacterium]